MRGEALAEDKAPAERRYKVRFPDRESYFAATALETPGLSVPVANQKRAYLGITLPRQRVGMMAAEGLLDAQLQRFETYGARIVEDFRFDLEPTAPPLFGLDAAPEEAEADLDDVLSQIAAPAAWTRSRGEDVAIAVVDSGIDGTRPEFPRAKRFGSWQPAGHLPWTDGEGHGTMCASIAAGTRAAGGAYDGVAPNAKLIACKSGLYDTELTAIYDYLISLLDAHPDLRIVATNSFGIKTGKPPSPPEDVDFPDAVAEAVGRGISVFFSAGNYHALAGGAAADCSPTSIWLHKCRDDVFTVATCDLAGRMWDYSSRGPGQHFGQHGMRRKPDATAPTPRNGRVVYGAGIRVLPTGWGTSGACPQVAGLAALLLSANRALSPAQVYDAIRSAGVPLGHGADCEGSGRIDCGASMALV
ncbi:MAG TPA: S8 family serine peptidase [Thermoanaerobaculia bacterium]|nr:S8 family serine peptidase [Thermoanaerobaculia bacterium]